MLGVELPVGMWFYQNMAEDKVSATFVLAPVFFAFVLRYLKVPTKGNLILIFLSGIGLTLTHPIVLFFSCVVAGGLMLFSWVTTRTGWRMIFSLMMVFTVLMLPYAVIRVSDIPSQWGMPFTAEVASTTFEFNRYVNVVNNVFYGLNPGVLKFIDIAPEYNGYIAYQFFRLIPVALAVFAGVVAFLNYKKGPLYWYIFSCVLLVFFATLPYTGWIIGYFVSARVVSRASWLLPLGLSGVLILKLLRDWLRARHIIDESGKILFFKRLNFEFFGISMCLMFAGPLVVYTLFFLGRDTSRSLIATSN